MADHEFFGTVSVSEVPTASDHIARKNETDAVQAYAVARANHVGTQSADSVIDGTTNKAYTATEKTKLSGIATAATANATDAQLRDRSTHTGTQSADTLTDGVTNKAFLGAERTKLSGIATGATVNSADSTLLARGNHTGTQPASTISDFATAVDTRIGLVVDGAPGALDTLNELAAALGDDPAFATTVTGLIGALDTRVDDLEANAGVGAYKASIGNGSLTTFTVTHNKGTLDVIVEVVRVSDGQTVFPVVKRPTTNTITVDFGSTVPASSAYRVIVDAK